MTLPNDAGPHVNASLSSWGRTVHSPCDEFTPSDAESLRAVLPAPGWSTRIARGYARSYGDCCLNSDGGVVTATGLRALEVDRVSGVAVCEAGVSLRDLTAVAEPLGWALPVYPGTGFVSVGGAIANDVHGKEQHVHGTFGHAVRWLDLLLASGDVVRIGPQDTDLFSATVAGVGLTGIIVRAAVQLVPLRSNAMRVRFERFGSLSDAIERFTISASGTQSMVAWVDLMTASSGRGILELSNPSSENVPFVSPRAARNIPVDFPAIAINRWSMSAFNALYFHRVPAAGVEKLVHRNRYLFPLDALGMWNRVYGKRGLHQFQCCVPSTNAVDCFEEMRSMLRHAGIGSTLAVMKLVGKAGPGFLSFLEPGFSLAMDFPGGTQSEALIHRLHAVAMEAGGRVYLAKDSCLRPGDFQRMYPRLAEFREVIARVDPERRWQSDMSRRLQMHAA
jgi:decaprenylphospho-beta-D-ribofuranose 2-oxidase